MHAQPADQPVVQTDVTLFQGLRAQSTRMQPTISRRVECDTASDIFFNVLMSRVRAPPSAATATMKDFADALVDCWSDQKKKKKEIVEEIQSMMNRLLSECHVVVPHSSSSPDDDDHPHPHDAAALQRLKDPHHQYLLHQCLHDVLDLVIAPHYQGAKNAVAQRAVDVFATFVMWGLVHFRDVSQYAMRNVWVDGDGARPMNVVHRTLHIASSRCITHGKMFTSYYEILCLAAANGFVVVAQCPDLADTFSDICLKTCPQNVPMQFQFVLLWILGLPTKGAVDWLSHTNVTATRDWFAQWILTQLPRDEPALGGQHTMQVVLRTNPQTNVLVTMSNHLVLSYAEPPHRAMLPRVLTCEDDGRFSNKTWKKLIHSVEREQQSKYGTQMLQRSRIGRMLVTMHKKKCDHSSDEWHGSPHAAIHHMATCETLLLGQRDTRSPLRALPDDLVVEIMETLASKNGLQMKQARN